MELTQTMQSNVYYTEKQSSDVAHKFYLREEHISKIFALGLDGF